MQSVSKGPALRAVDGGLKNPAIHVSLPGQCDDAGVPGDSVADAIRSVVPGIRISQSAVEASLPARLSIAQEAVAAAPANIVRTRSFGPLIATRIPWLDLAIVSTDASAATNPFDKRASFVDASSVELACRYALRFGRPAVCLLQSPFADDDESAAIEQLRETAAERYPALEITVSSVTAAAASLAAGESELDVVVTTPAYGAILNEVAAGLCGAAALRTEMRFTGTGVAAGGAASVENGANGPGMASLLLAAVDLLTWLGHVQAATRLGDGWRRTLEFGMHTQEFSLQNPCSRELDAAEFASAVVERLGELPRTGKQPDDASGNTLRCRPTLALVE